MANVYVSSTYVDLIEYRKTVSTALRRLGHDDVAMEYYTAEDARPLERCLQDVRDCDVYIGLFAWRYGHVPPGQTESITHLEYLTAIEEEKPRLLFLADPEAPWPPKMIEQERHEEVAVLRTMASDDRLISFFSSPDSLRGALVEALHNWAGEEGLDEETEVIGIERYREAAFEQHRWVRMAVIAGAKYDAFVQIPLADVFVPPDTQAGLPEYEIPEEVLRLRKELFDIAVIGGSAESEPQVEPGEVAQLADGDDDPDEEDEDTQGVVAESSVDILARETKQVILGGPGSGKSTLLLYALLRLCRPDGSAELPPNLDRRPVPFLINLRDYVITEATDFTHYISHTAGSLYGADLGVDLLTRLFDEADSALVMFDGLDEIFDREERARVINHFTTFARRHPSLKLVVTSRIVGYDPTELGLAGFEHYVLQPLSYAGIAAFVPRWYEHYAWETESEDSEALLARIRESPRLFELASNPLLLTMMAIIAKHQDLPEQRWKLYERCSEVLLEDWDVKRKRFDVTELLPADVTMRTPQKAEVLQRVASYMMDHQEAGREANAIAHQQLIHVLADYLAEKYEKPPGEANALAEDILTHLRERTYVLASVGEGIYAFVHRTFMEFFAAEAARDAFNGRRADYAWLTTLYADNWATNEWQEILLLLAGMVSDQGSPIREAVDSVLARPSAEAPWHLVFAARCLNEARDVEDLDWARNILHELVVALTEQVTATRRPDAVKFVDAGLGAFSALAPRVGVVPDTEDIIEALGTAASFRERFAAWQMSLALKSPGDRVAFALNALSDPSEAVRRAAIAVLERERAGWEEIRTRLLDVARHDRHSRVRQAALEALQQGWEPDERVLAVIAERAELESAYTYVRWLIDFLGSNWATNSATLSIMFRLVSTRATSRDYDYGSVRRAAVQTLRDDWTPTPSLLDYLRSKLVPEVDIEERLLAVEAIGEMWRGSTSTLPILVEAYSDEDARVREAALQRVATGWPESEETLGLLHFAAGSDPSAVVRGASVRILAGASLRGNYTAPYFLRRRIESLPRDRGEHRTFLRRVILHRRSRWLAEPVVKDLLRHIAAHDDAEDVRATAIQVIALDDPTSEQTRNLLLERISSDPSTALRAMALDALAEAFPSEPTVYDWAINLTTDDDALVRASATRAVLLHEKSDQAALMTLLAHASDDPDTGVRGLALVAVARKFAESTEVKGLVWSTASDTAQSSATRRSAVEAIRYGWMGSLDALNFLLHLIRGDEDLSVRAIALAEVSGVTLTPTSWDDTERTFFISEERESFWLQAEEPTAWAVADETFSLLYEVVMDEHQPSVLRTNALYAAWRFHSERPETVQMFEFARDDPSMRNWAPGFVASALTYLRQTR
jgi:hypothetical protein